MLLRDRRSLLNEVMHHGDQAVLNQRLQQEAVGSSFLGARGGGQDRENEYGQRFRGRAGLDLSAQREPVELRQQDLGDHERKVGNVELTERFVRVSAALDAVAGLDEKVFGQLANVWVSLNE